MRLVVDANILFAALLREGDTAELLIYSDLALFAPETLFREFEKYEHMLEARSTHIQPTFQEVLKLIRKRVAIIEVLPEYFRAAEQFSPDLKDSAYLALALQLNIPLWTNDKVLQRQQRGQIYATAELLNFLR